MKNCIKIALVIIGALIGAGFASGQEIYLFFFSYGKRGILGIGVSAILLGIIIYKTMIIIKKNKNINDIIKKVKKNTNDLKKKKSKQIKLTNS